MDDGSRVAVTDSATTNLEDDAVERSVVEHLPASRGVVGVGGVKGEKLVLFVEDIVAELEVLLEERFDAKGVLLVGGCDSYTKGFLVGCEGKKIVVFLNHKFKLNGCAPNV